MYSEDSLRGVGAACRLALFGLWSVGLLGACGPGGVEVPPSSQTASASQALASSCTTPPTFAGLVAVTDDATALCGTHLSWSAGTPSCGGSLTYSVYRSTTSGFIPSADNRIATGLTGTSYSDIANLVDGQTYWYVVRATESSSALEESNTVSGSVQPTGPSVPAIRFFDDFDSNRPSNASAYLTANNDSLNIVSGCHYQSASNAYRFGAQNTACGGTYPPDATGLLFLGGDGSTPGVNGFTLPANVTSAKLSFNLWYTLENGFDNANLLYSTSGLGGPWTLLRSWTGSNNPDNGALTRVEFDLSGQASKTVWFAFQFQPDSIVEYEGFYLDDVHVDVDVGGTCGTYVPGALGSFQIGGLAASVAAGAPVMFTVQALDTFGQPLTSYSGSANVVTSDPLATVSTPLAFAGGQAAAQITFGRAGTQSLIISDASNANAASLASTLVVPGSPSQLIFVTQPAATLVAGGTFTPPVQVGVMDAYGNLASSVAPTTVTLAAQGGSTSLSGTTSAQTVGGVATFSGVSVDKVGTGLTLQATAAGLAPATSTSFSVVNAPAATLDVVIGTPVKQGQPVLVTVTALDAQGNPAKDDQGTVAFSCSDPHAQLPAPIALYDGRAQASVVFGTAGAQTLTVTDTSNGSVIGSQTATVGAVDGPTVTLLTPNDGASLSGKVPVIASATVGAGTSVSSLSILIDGQPLQSGPSAIVNATWDTASVDAKKAHVLTAQVVDQAGNTATSAKVTVTVNATSSGGGGCTTTGGPQSALYVAVLGLLHLTLRRRVQPGARGRFGR